MTLTSFHAPCNKFDHDTVASLDTLPVSNWKHLIPDILTWLGDVNWPIFFAVRDLLLKNARNCVPHLRRIFNGDDEVLQWNCLNHLIPQMPEKCLRALASDLRRYRDGVSDEVDAEFDMRELVDEVLTGICEDGGDAVGQR